MTVRWGILGAGGIAYRRMIPEMTAAAPHTKLVAIMGVNQAKTQRIGTEYDVPKVYYTEEDLLNDPEVDAVYVASPPAEHFRQVTVAAARGKHVLCEKPMALSVGDAEAMVAACDQAGVAFGVNYMMRFNVHNQRVRDLVATGQLGQPVMARAQLTCWYPPIPGAWRQTKALAYGGSLMDMGSHCLDLIEWIVGSPITEIFAFQNHLVHQYEVEDTSTTLVRFANGAHGIVDNYFNVPDDAATNVLELYGTLGSVQANGTIGQDPTGTITTRIVPSGLGYDAAQARETPSSAIVESEQLPGVPLFATHIDQFSQAVERGESVPVPATIGLHNLRALMAAYESVRRKASVPVG